MSTLAKPKKRRIVEFDIIRGIFLLMILIDHIELYPSGFDYLTGRGRMFVTAAAGFFFMSGLLVGVVYKRRLALGMKFIFTKMWKRALELYAGSVVLTLLFAYAAVKLNHPDIKYGLPPLPIDWLHTIKETLLMRFGFGWADFLDRFAILMIMAPLGFYLLAKGRWRWLLTGSFILWLFRGQNFTLSWQIIFFGGMIIGFHWQQLANRWAKLTARKKRQAKWSVIGLTVVSFGYSYSSVFILSVLNDRFASLPHWLASFTSQWDIVNDWLWRYAEKWTMGPLRIILFMIWFAALFMLVNRYIGVIKRYGRGIVELVGSNSLFVYIAESFIVFIFKLFIPSKTNLLANFLITLASLAALIAVTYLYKRYHPAIMAKKTHLYQKIPWLPANVES